MKFDRVVTLDLIKRCDKEINRLEAYARLCRAEGDLREADEAENAALGWRESKEKAENQ